jgi:putative two-component system response regulator
MMRVCDCEVVDFSDPIAAVEWLQTEDFDIALVDYMMDGMDGISVIHSIRMVDRHRHVPIIMVTGEDERTVRIDAIQAGATDFLTKPIEPVEFKARVKNLLDLRKAQLAIAERAKWLETEIAIAMRRLNEREKELVFHLARAIESRDGNTGAHVTRMAEIARLISVELGLPDELARTIHLAAPLHDVGKIGVADALLTKPGALTPEERIAIQHHVTFGEHILSGSSSDLVRMACDIASAHHERWNGTGYPRGLAGEQIPLGGRIAAIADVFDALVSARPYKARWSLDKARDYILEAAGTEFDPACVSAFDRRWNDIRSLYADQEFSAVA